jgi:hypothetical protein
LIPNLEKPKEQEILDFREACDKVIHAKSVEPETVQTTPGTAPPLTGRLVLYGDRQGKEWCAELDLKEYAFCALTLNP